MVGLPHTVRPGRRRPHRTKTTTTSALAAAAAAAAAATLLALAALALLSLGAQPARAAAAPRDAADLPLQEVPLQVTSATTSSPPPSSSSSSSPPSPPSCDPLPLCLDTPSLCQHITQHCPSTGRLDYLYFYYCGSLARNQTGGGGDDHDGNGGDHTLGLHAQRALAMAAIVVWIVFLFTCLGLVASDFFCPNLGTIASRLGMNESTAGVTFLALGNGSPDVFSTFSAMSSGSGPLAIGELIGAASFIVSVVAGSMMLIKPFRVKPYPFLRDVGFFTLAVALTMVYLLDGKLTLAECLAMVGLYLAYATTVIVGSLWQERQRRRRALWQQSRSDYSVRSPPISPRGTPLLSPIADDDGGGGGGDQRAGDHLETGRHLTLSAATRARPLASPEYDPDPDLDADPFEVWSDHRRLTDTATHTAGAGSLHLAASSNASRTASQKTTPNGSPILGPTLVAPHRLVRSRSRFRGASAGHMPRHSLLGAVEFRDVVASLSSNAANAARPGPMSRTTSSGSGSHGHGRSISISGAGNNADILDAAMSRDPERYLPHPHPHPHTHAHAHAHRHRSRHRGRGTSLGGNEPFLPRSRTHGRHADSGSSTPAAAASHDSSSPSLSPPKPDMPRRQTTTGAAPQPLPLKIKVGGLEDPWKEHGPADGCEGEGESLLLLPVLPDPAIPLPGGVGSSSDAAATKPALPRLQIPSEAAAATQRGKGVSRDRDRDRDQDVPAITISSAGGGGGGGGGGEAADAEWGAQHDAAAADDDEPPLFRSLVRFLFPSLRHWKSKSLLGRVLSVLNAPPLLVLNLTLPVVDDEAEARAAAAATEGGRIGGEGEGALKLTGDEAPLFARQPGDEDARSDCSDTLLDLSTGRRTAVTPADAEEDAGGADDEDPWKAQEDKQRRSNTRRDLEVAQALRRLPAEETSPLTFGAVSPARKQSQHERDRERDCGCDCSDSGSDSDAASTTSSSSSAASHAVPRGLPRIVISSLQCLLAPPFCVWASTDFGPLPAAASLLSGVLLSSGVLFLSLRARGRASAPPRHFPSARASASASAPAPPLATLARCFLGFTVSIAWISTIVNEVVAILQALGLICGLSDAILGLTIFAAGNSLADLVADVTIARAGYPVMAISACFAGPLLNLLLGIGLSGTWILSTRGDADGDGGGGGSGSGSGSGSGDTPGTYHLALSPTLLSSGLGLLFVLLGTLVVVPLNGFLLGRSTGWALIGAYVLVMGVNIGVEVSGVGR